MNRWISSIAAACTLIAGLWTISSAADAQFGPPPPDNGDQSQFGPPPPQADFDAGPQQYGSQRSGPPPFAGPPPSQELSPAAMLLPPGLDAPMLRGMRDLDLTAAQHDRIRNILIDGRDEVQDLHDQLRALHDQSTALWQSSSFDESAARALAAKEVEAVEKLDKIGCQAQANIYTTVLTADQRSELIAAMPPAGAAPRPPAPSVDRRVDDMSRLLDLTQDQSTKLIAIQTDRDSARRSASDSLKPIWDAYMRLSGSGTFDAATLQSALDKSAPILIDAMTADLKSQSRTWSLLTADQQERLKSMPPPPQGPMEGPPGPGGFGRGPSGPGGAPDGNQFGAPAQGPPPGPPPGQGPDD